ncbi:MAG TPA: ADP-ribosylglycohydrolase family protein, partial [Cyclobacteriaceae bacterium]|nr:ADP-ribosylglycohydrolase family protein [Cyclobacteriaceae bacterium]
YLELSLNQVYELSYKHALQMIERNGGQVTDTDITIAVQKPVTLPLEQSYEGLYPASELLVRKDHLEEPIVVNFTGNGVVVLGNLRSVCGVSTSDYVALLDVYIDGEKVEQVKMPFDYIVRKYDIYHKYLLPQGEHKVEIKWVNQNPDFRLYHKSHITYSDSPVQPINPNAG